MSGFGTCPVCESKGYAACHCPELGKYDLLGRKIEAWPPIQVEPAEAAPRAIDRQEGGRHYKDLAIQPVEYIHRNSIGFCEGSAIKYLTRWRAKGGVEDLKKARHFIDLLIEMETTK